MALHRRRILLINKPFQFRFIFYVCSWVFALSLIYPYLIMELFDWFYRRLGADPTGPAIQALQGTKTDFLILLAILQVTFIAIIFFLTLFMSHRIAGPIYKLRKLMNEARNGRLEPVSFRKSDHFQELAADYNRLVESIRDTVAAAKIHADRALEKNPDEATRKELLDLVSTLNHLSH